MTEEQAGKQDIRSELREFISRNYVLPEGLDSLNDNDSFLDKGIIDSTGVLELVMFVEETFDIRVEDEELIPENLDSVDQLVAFLQLKLGN